MIIIEIDVNNPGEWKSLSRYRIYLRDQLKVSLSAWLTINPVHVHSFVGLIRAEMLTEIEDIDKFVRHKITDGTLTKERALQLQFDQAVRDMQ